MSDAGNRDDSLERLLRKARPMLGGSATPEACLDAETVAAWAAGGLSDDELERAQIHTAGCTRCQSLVAMMVRVDPAAAIDEVPAPSSRKWIGWLVPLAAAAGVTLFVLTRMPESAPVPPVTSAAAPTASPGADRLAQGPSAPAPAVPPPSVAREATPAAAALADMMKQGAARQEAERRVAAPAPFPAPALAAPEARPTDATVVDRARAAENRPAGLGQVGSTMGGIAGGIAAPKASATIPPPPAPVVAPPAASPAIAPPPPPPAQTAAAQAPPVTAMAENVIVAAPPSSAQLPAFAAAGAGGGFAGGRGGRGGGGGGRGGAPVALDGVAVVELGTVVVAPPDSTVRWRATGALVERSTDAGATWQFVARVVDANFRAASTPSPLVCWFVGRDGVVVVFTEGRTARAVTFPELVHLTSVRATDERTATVTTINGRQYGTTDGGLSWNVR